MEGCCACGSAVKGKEKMGTTMRWAAVVWVDGSPTHSDLRKDTVSVRRKAFTPLMVTTLNKKILWMHPPSSCMWVHALNRILSVMRDWCPDEEEEDEEWNDCRLAYGSGFLPVYDDAHNPVPRFRALSYCVWVCRRLWQAGGWRTHESETHYSWITLPWHKLFSCPLPTLYSSRCSDV
jgi:hypothetical protein